MIYKPVRIKKCPFCGKGQKTYFLESACPFCGKDAGNICSNAPCACILASNARFCGVCGAESLYYAKGLLRAWNEE